MTWNQISFFLNTRFLSYNSHTLKSTHLKCTIQCFIVCSQSCCATTLSIYTTTTKFRTFPSHQKESVPIKWLLTLHSCQAGSHGSGFRCGFTYSGCVTEIESDNMWLSVSGIFNLAWCFQDSSMLQQDNSFLVKDKKFWCHQTCPYPLTPVVCLLKYSPFKKEEGKAGPTWNYEPHSSCREGHRGNRLEDIFQMESSV